MARHCELKLIHPDAARQHSIAGVDVTFGADNLGRGPMGERHFSEEVGQRAEKFPASFDVNWRQGQCSTVTVPTAAPTAQRAVAGVSLPTRQSLASEGLPPEVVNRVLAEETYRYTHEIWPYGQEAPPPRPEWYGSRSDRPVPPSPLAVHAEAPAVDEGPAAPVFEDETPTHAVDPEASEEVDSVSPEVSEVPDPDAPRTHYEQRKEELEGYANKHGGGRKLQEIAAAHNVTATSKRALADRILYCEFPNDHPKPDEE